jgi:hypothetical protein
VAEIIAYVWRLGSHAGLRPAPSIAPTRPAG